MGAAIREGGQGPLQDWKVERMARPGERLERKDFTLKES